MGAAHEKGFTLWELIIVVVLVILFFAVALENLLPLRGHAERAQVLHTVGAIRSGLGLEATRRVLESPSTDLGQIAAENPLNWLASPPPTGGKPEDGLASMPDGRWMWVPQSSTLVYRLKYPQYVENAYRDEWIRYRLEFNGGNGHSPSLTLKRVDNIRWQLPGNAEEVMSDEYLDGPSD